MPRYLVGIVDVGKGQFSNFVFGLMSVRHLFVESFAFEWLSYCCIVLYCSFSSFRELLNRRMSSAWALHLGVGVVCCKVLRSGSSDRLNNKHESGSPCFTPHLGWKGGDRVLLIINCVVVFEYNRLIIDSILVGVPICLRQSHSHLCLTLS